MESENKEKYIFYDLTPTNDVSLDIYEDAINFSLKNNKVLNAAISGSYGSGKSSLLESYRKKHPEKRFIHISLTHFNSMENENNKIEKKATGVNNNTREEENNENKNNKSLVTMLEAKILNQLIHQISYEKIPQTYFKTKRKFTEKELENSTLQILLFIISFLYVIYFNKWYDFVLTLSDETILYSFFKITTYSYFRLVGASFLFYLLWELIYKVLKIQKTKNFFKKLNIQGNEFEIAGDNDDSYFDKYLNEVMYLFENSGVDVIVFEDIDRYEISEIFERLREVNRLVNNKLKEEGKTLKFFYLLKDDIFISIYDKNLNHLDREKLGAVKRNENTIPKSIIKPEFVWTKDDLGKSVAQNMLSEVGNQPWVGYVHYAEKASKFARTVSRTGGPVLIGYLAKDLYMDYQVYSGRELAKAWGADLIPVATGLGGGLVGSGAGPVGAFAVGVAGATFGDRIKDEIKFNLKRDVDK